MDTPHPYDLVKFVVAVYSGWVICQFFGELLIDYVKAMVGAL